MTRAALALWLMFLSGVLVAEPHVVTIGSKNFPESYLLAEIAAQRLESKGVSVHRRFGLGGTKVAYEALRGGSIDFYPEYTGTISETLLDMTSDQSLEAGLARLSLRFLAPLGFDNTYVLAVRPTLADSNLRTLSDLRLRPELRVALSHEFLSRSDGWPGLRQHYQLSHSAIGIQHGLAYEALANEQIDVTDAYSTDGDIVRYGLQLLDDDLDYFPEYQAGWLATTELVPTVVSVLDEMAGRIDAARMRELNAEIVVKQRSYAAVASEFLASEFKEFSGDAAGNATSSLWRYTLQHLQLTVLAILAATAIGVPLALISFSRPRLANAVLYISGLLQTIPSIALLALMIPLLGIGFVPALVALLLYALLPILRATLTALNAVDPLHRRVAAAMGMSRAQEFRHVLIPLAIPHVLAGVRTASVISIGTATLAAFIGAGGLGEPIVTGLALNDTRLILSGAIPAALLAIATDLAFDALERRLIPPHLRVSGQLS